MERSRDVSDGEIQIHVRWRDPETCEMEICRDMSDGEILRHVLCRYPETLSDGEIQRHE